MWFRKASARRQAIREDVAEAHGQPMLTRGRTAHVILIALAFGLIAALIQFWPGVTLPYRQGQRAPADLVAPTDFDFADPAMVRVLQEAARATSPPVLMLERNELDHVSLLLSNMRSNARDARKVSQLSREARALLPGITDEVLVALQDMPDDSFNTAVNLFVHRDLPSVALISAQDDEVRKEKEAAGAIKIGLVPTDSVTGYVNLVNINNVYVVGTGGVAPSAASALKDAAVNEFDGILGSYIASYFQKNETRPTYAYNPRLSQDLADANAEQATQHVPGATHFRKGEPIVRRGEEITSLAYQELVAAQLRLESEIARDHPWSPWLSRFGYVLTALILTAAGALYVARMALASLSMQRAWAVCALLLATLITAKAVVTSAPSALCMAGIAPTLLTAIILVIAFNQRFAMSLAALHGLLVTITLRQGLDFLLPLIAGSAVLCIGLHEIRTRGKLIVVGFFASAAIFITLWAVGLSRVMGLAWDPSAGSTDPHAIWSDSLWGAGAGISVAMFALAILPSVERIFRITTAMTLLELCDANKPLLRRMSVEAPGTFNHSLTVGIMAEASGNAIGANGLLCRVGAYYHDIGKLSKPQYFIENQMAGGPSRHDKLSPAMSLLIIVGHVKDGIELACEYGLPWAVQQCISQHHGTTLVEYFYHAARKRAAQDEDGPRVSETEFRYPGPRPQTREVAIVMICDACESLVRAIEEPTAGRIETAVHNMIMKRLMDGQFNDCELTLRDLTIIEETLVRTLAGIHHGRIAYPSRPNEGIADVGLSQPA